MSIEQMIDNAIEDWRTSPDAMRWTPEPAKLELAKWQADIARAFGVPAEFLVRTAPPTVDQFAESIKGARLSFVLFDEPFRQLPLARNRMRTCEPLRPARISSMRSAYRHKTRNR